jgi:Cdc6-like AAA superfamily ATPase
MRNQNYASLADVGLKAVLSLWHEDSQSFARSSIDDPGKLRPTVTFRCVEILLDTTATQPESMRADPAMLESAAAHIVNLDAGTVLDASELAYAPFTFALWTLAMARIAVGTTASAPAAGRRVPELLKELRSMLAPSELDRVHPFVQEHALRAALACRSITRAKANDNYIAALRRSLAVATESLLARHVAGLITPGESVVLVFCGAALSTSRNRSDDRLALAALCAAASAQDASGSWPLGRVVRDEPSRLEISTYEVAWAMTDTLNRLLDGPLGRTAAGTRAQEIDSIVAAIGRATVFMQRSMLELDDFQRGWATDHPYQEARIESWTSAIALQFALAGEKLRDRMRNAEVLDSFSATYPDDPSWPGWLRWKTLTETGEPDSSHPIYRYLERRVIEPIEASPQQLPSGSNETASVLLFGPPGTSKTTLVKAVADRLGWPIVSLSPGTFIEQGLEGIEASAKSVFARLLELRQVIVIFDECDELFRDRSPAGSTEQTRNISAFVTASMLPKLQDLHDRGKVLFFICTNHAAMMDTAVLRGGRIDHRLGVGPPDAEARRTIIAGFRDELPETEQLDEALEQLSLAAERFSRGELRRAAYKLSRMGPWSSRKAAIQSAIDVAQEMEETLTISEDAMRSFLEQQKKMSDPYLEGTG